MKYEDDFDGLLKDALREVSDAEPRMGLEGRVLARLTATAGERRVAWWKWVALAAAMLVIALVVAVRREPKVNVVRQERVEVIAPQKKVEEARVAGEPQRPLRRQETAVKIRRRKAKPTLSIATVATNVPLLAPTPMNDEEKALMLLARSNPGVLESVRREQQAQGQEIAPIQVEAIKISGIGEKEQ